MGEVYEATHARLAGRYAVKLLVEEISQDEDAIRRFQQEAEVTSRLRHPNIVPVIDFDRMDGGAMYMVMEFLEGHDLATELHRGTRIPMARVAEIVDQVASGLAAAHAANIVHRDLKPGNLFLTPLPGRNRELVRILDFGISKVRVGDEAVTRSQALLGTPRYMAPEQARGRTREIDVGTDQFALATIAYEMLTGLPAFAATELAAIVYQIVHEEPRSFSTLGLPALRPLEPVLGRALAKAPGDRYPTIHDFAQAFVEAVSGFSSASHFPPETGFPQGSTLRSLRAQGGERGPTTLGLSSGEQGGGRSRPRTIRGRDLLAVGAVAGVLISAGMALPRLWKGRPDDDALASWRLVDRRSASGPTLRPDAAVVPGPSQAPWPSSATNVPSAPVPRTLPAPAPAPLSRSRRRPSPSSNLVREL